MVNIVLRWLYIIPLSPVQFSTEKYVYILVISWLNKQLNEQTINKLNSTHMSSSTANIQNNRVPYIQTLATTTMVPTAVNENDFYFDMY